MNHNVFISFSSRDRDSANRIRDAVEQSGFRCWISSRDVGPGENYQVAIVNALQAAPVFLLVFSPHSNDSAEVHKEVSLASAYKKVVIPVRINDLAPTGAMAYELATRQWVDAFAAWDSAMEQLVAALQRVVTPGQPADALRPSPVAAPAPAPVAVAPAPAAPAAVEAKPALAAISIFSRAELEKVRDALTAYVGADADELVKKAAGEARSVGDLHKRLTAHIPQPDDKAAFQQKVRRQF